GRGGYRRAFPAFRSAVEGGAKPYLPAPCDGAGARARLCAGELRCDNLVRTPQDRPASGRHAAGPGRYHGGRGGTDFRQGDHDRETGVHRARGGDRSASHRPSGARMMKLIATFGFVGHLRPAPGTWGSLAAVVLAVAAYELGLW